MRITIFAIALSALLFSCNKEPLSDVDTIHFGFYNFSWGTQCERYELTPDRLMTTSSPCTPNGDTVVYDIDLGADKFEAVRDLLNSIPEDYFTRPGGAEAAVCCNDCGGYAIEVIRGGQSRVLSFTDAGCGSPSRADKKLFKKVIAAVGELRK